MTLAWISDYEGNTPATLWMDPAVVAPLIDLDPADTDELQQAADLTAEASSLLDQYTGRRYGPARCVIATYRMRGMPLLNLTPPAGTIVKVAIMHDECMPNQPVPMIDEHNPTSLMGSLAPPDLDYARNLVAMIAQSGDRVGNMAEPGPLFVIEPGQCQSTGYSYCLDSANLMRLCGFNAMKTLTCGPSCVAKGAELVTVFYRSRENWPPGTKRALTDLIRGMATSSGICALPGKTTSIQRQGVSWTVEESDGVTGVASADRWIERFRPRIRLSDPLRASMTQMQYVDCEAFYPFYAEDQYVPLGEGFSDELLPDAVPTDPLGLLECASEEP